MAETLKSLGATPNGAQKEDTLMPHRVASEPLKEIKGQGENAKYIHQCTDINLGHRGIEKIRGFERLTNLENLWLNNNNLTKINRLDRNIRIRSLHVQNNRIGTLKGSMAKFLLLEELDVSNNCLRDLQKVLAQLENQRALRHLELRGNPCCNEPNYRLTTIHRLPFLEILDLLVISPEEREKARWLFEPMDEVVRVVFFKCAPRSRSPSPTQNKRNGGQLVLAERARRRELTSNVWYV